jgi:HK97 family phage major capsid protein
MANIADLRAKRASLVAAAREVLDAAGDNLSAEKQAEFDRIDSEIDTISDRITKEEKILAVEASLAKPVNRDGLPTNEGDDGKGPTATKGYHNAFREFVRLGRNGITSDIVGALQVGTDSEGGYLTPEEFETRLVQTMEPLSVMRQISSVITTGSDRNIPVETSRSAATWTAEEAAYTTSDPVFSRVTLGAHKLGVIVKVSEELLQDAFFNIDAYMVDNFGRAFAEAEETAYVAGDGSGKPTGVAGSASAGVTAAAVAAITGDELIDLFHALKPGYRGRANWLMKDSTAKLVRKLKDGDSQYLWQPGLQAGQPDTLLGRPVQISDGVAAAAASAVSVMFGDFSHYQIVDRAGVSMQRLNELYAANGQVGFKAFKRTEGKLLLAEAVKKLTMAAS